MFPVGEGSAAVSELVESLGEPVDVVSDPLDDPVDSLEEVLEAGEVGFGSAPVKGSPVFPVGDSVAWVWGVGLVSALDVNVACPVVPVAGSVVIVGSTVVTEE